MERQGDHVQQPPHGGHHDHHESDVSEDDDHGESATDPLIAHPSPDRDLDGGDDTPVWHALDVEQVCRLLHTDPSLGLPTQQQQPQPQQHRRRHRRHRHIGDDHDHTADDDEEEEDDPLIVSLRNKYGRNDFPLQPRRPSAVVLLVRQLADLMQLILLATSLVALAIGDLAASSTLGVVVLFNVAVGFLQERKAEQAVWGLMRRSQWYTAHRATVTRGGKQRRVDASELVPGDLVSVEEGDQVPADLRLVEQWGDLQATEALLTGESAPVHKHTQPITTDDETSDQNNMKVALGDRHNMLYMSTVVARGRGRGVVVATGLRTEVGKIRDSILADQQHQGRQLTTSGTVLQRKLSRLGVALVCVSAGLCALVTVVGILYGKQPYEMVTIGIALAVSVIPEGLVACTTAVMALGVQRMARKSAIMRHMPAVETLGSVTAICTDKTGTLTTGEMRTRAVWTRAQQYMVREPDAGRSDWQGSIFVHEQQQRQQESEQEHEWEAEQEEKQAEDEDEEDLQGADQARLPLLQRHRDSNSSSSERRRRSRRRTKLTPVDLFHQSSRGNTNSWRRLPLPLSKMLLVMSLGNDATLQASEDDPDHRLQMLGDPTDVALALPALYAGITKRTWTGSNESGSTGSGPCEFCAEHPFSSSRMRMSAVYRVQHWGRLPPLYVEQRQQQEKSMHIATSTSTTTTTTTIVPSAGSDASSDDSRLGSGLLIVCKGALESMLSVCSHMDDGSGHTVLLTDAHKRKLEDRSEKLTAKGLRVLAMAYRVVLQKSHGSSSGAQDVDAENMDAVECDLTFLGLTGVMDPPRPGVKDAISVLRDAGIKVVMITGDHPNTAEFIARKLGIIGITAPGGSISLEQQQREEGHENRDLEDPYFHSSRRSSIDEGDNDRPYYYHPIATTAAASSAFSPVANHESELRDLLVDTGNNAASAAVADLLHNLDTDTVMTGRDLDLIMAYANTSNISGRPSATSTSKLSQLLHPFPCVFARVSPENKVQIMEALRQRGDVCAMIGDGVNDAPAMRKAHAGVAMGRTGTDIAREAASVVLADDNFVTIVTAVREGRRTYDNILLFVLYLLSANLGEIFVVLLSTLANLPPPFSAIQILYANLIGDTPPALALGVEPEDEDLMRRRPRDPYSAVLSLPSWLFVVGQGLLQATIALTAFCIALYVEHYTLGHARSLVWALLLCVQLVYAFQCRSLTHSLLEETPLGNPWMTGAIVLSLLFVLAGLYIPGLNKVMELQPLTGWDWVKVGLAVLLHVAISELMKLALRVRRSLAERQWRWQWATGRQRQRFYSEI